ncbi:MAG: V-type ATP synthase subunit I [Mangrovibacterium sp.]
MVVPMLKYSFAVYHPFYRHFLDDLQDLKVVHVDRSREKQVAGEAAELARESEQIGRLLEQLKLYRQEQPGNDSTLLSVKEVIVQAGSLLKRLAECRSAREQLQEILDTRVVWGDYSPKLLEEMTRAGIPFRFYTVPAKKFSNSWQESFPLEIVSHSEREIHFVLIGPDQPSLEGAREVHPPKEELGKLNKRMDGLRGEEKKICSRLQQLAGDSWSPLQERRAWLGDRLEWLDIRDNRTAQAAEGRVDLLEGWVPVTAAEKLDCYLEKKGILFLREEASPADLPPVKLTNNRFARLFEPITKLFSLPVYGEMDLTVYFAPFFLLFFGFCLGDAGYGLVILLGTSFAKRFTGKEMKAYLSLGQLFGAATLLVGLAFGTFFGVELAKLPALEQVSGLFLDSSKIFTLSLIIGAVQITYGICLRVINQLRSTVPSLALGSLGWLLLILTAVVFEFLLAGAGSVFTAIVRKLLYGLALLLILLFSATGPVHTRLIGGIWDIYSNVTGIFGDLLSYIRLFALGIASSILGLVINQMAVAFGQAPYVGPVVFLLIILVGHTANLAISGLGAFVHPMRLTFVEFYKNAGFKGGGKTYRPFAKQKN